MCNWVVQTVKYGAARRKLLLPVVPDVLHIVIIFHGVDELLHHNGLLLVQGLVVLGDHLDLGGNENRPKNRGF